MVGQEFKPSKRGKSTTCDMLGRRVFTSSVKRACDIYRNASISACIGTDSIVQRSFSNVVNSFTVHNHVDRRTEVAAERTPGNATKPKVLKKMAADTKKRGRRGYDMFVSANCNSGLGEPGDGVLKK